jgi:hypothetical protein
MAALAICMNVLAISVSSHLQAVAGLKNDDASPLEQKRPRASIRRSLVYDIAVPDEPSGAG